MLQYLVQIQTVLHAHLTAYLKAFATSGDWVALASVLPMGIVFGAVHAVTPEHGKSVLSAYVAGSPIGRLRSLAVSLALSATHVFMAVAIVVFSLPLVRFAFGRGAGEAPLLEDVSRGLLVAVGLWMVVRAVRGSHAHTHGAVVGLVAGLVPCPLTLFAMTYATVKGVPEAGIAFAVAMMLGVAFTLSLVALGTVMLRQGAARLFASTGWTAAGRVLEGIMGAILVAIAAGELLGP